MPFEVFDKRSASSSKSPMATIQRQGSFSLNRAAYELAGKPDHVELLYDRSEKLIAFRPVDESNPRAFPFRPQGKNASTYMVAGKAFANHYKIDTRIARRYSVTFQNGMLVLDLKADSVDVTGPRARQVSVSNNEESFDDIDF